LREEKGFTIKDARSLEEQLEQTWPSAQQNKREAPLHDPVVQETESSFVPVYEDDKILRASIYNFQDAKKKQELLLLSSQRLSALPRMIKCSNNDKAGNNDKRCLYISGICYEDYSKICDCDRDNIENNIGGFYQSMIKTSLRGPPNFTRSTLHLPPRRRMPTRDSLHGFASFYGDG
jgi:hypothetical protein